jgi:hypothetical protein
VPEIEFVDPDPDQGADEELTAGPTRQWSPRVKRAVRVGAGAVLAVVVGSVLVAVLQHGGGGKAAGGSSVLPASPVLAPEAPPSAFRVDHLGGAPEGARPGTLAGQTPQPSFDPTSSTLEPSTSPGLSINIDCPVVDACQIDLVLPPAVLDALRARLGTVTHLTGASVLVTGRTPALRDRQISARAGRLNVRVAVAPATAGARPRSSSSTVGAGITVSATAIERGFAVTVTVSGPDTQAPGQPTVEALAADRRLLTVG